MASDILTQLRERIVKAGYFSDAALNETQLAGEFGVSRTPIREALIHFECENLVASSQG